MIWAPQLGHPYRVVDLLIVGQPDQARLVEETRRAEKIPRRDLNYTLLAPQEFEQKRKAGDALITDIWMGKHHYLERGYRLLGGRWHVTEKYLTDDPDISFM